jgi:ABC-type spermidine/putrescine transport system permease subunit I
MSPATGRRVHLILMVLWLVVGLPVSYYLRRSIEWLVFLSVYAIVVSHWSGWSAERPTEVFEP